MYLYIRRETLSRANVKEHLQSTCTRQWIWGGSVSVACMDLTETDMAHLRRCVELAHEALTDGDEPFGSLLVDATGTVRFEDRNRVKGGDHTRHPEFAIARWSANHLSASERVNSTVYTSGEHCPMCSAAHAWMGLGRIVIAVSAAQLTAWQAEWGAGQSPVAPLPIHAVAPSIDVSGPAAALADDMYSLHRQQYQRRSDTDGGLGT